MDVYQGKMKTISPAVGPFDINVFINIDKITPETGGITGMGHIVPIKWDMSITGIDSGVTGAYPDNFTNMRHGF